MFINHLRDAICHSKYLLFSDDIKLYWAIKSPEDCNLLQSDTNCMQGWCTANYIILNISKTKVISFSWKSNILIYDYKHCQSSITRTDSIEDLGIYLDSKLTNVFYIFSHFLILGLVRSITFTF
jgi:hypothetical protein